jgi:hypothetical protein
MAAPHQLLQPWKKRLKALLDRRYAQSEDLSHVDARLASKGEAGSPSVRTGRLRQNREGARGDLAGKVASNLCGRHLHHQRLLTSWGGGRCHDEASRRDEKQPSSEGSMVHI